MRKLLIPVLSTAAMVTRLQGEIALPPLISDHMVLQSPSAAIWGKAAPGEKVSVTFGGLSAEAAGDRDGNWKVQLGGLKPGLAGTLVVEGRNRLSVEDVVVGDVWLASGQSNMAFAVQALANREEVSAAADHLAIRMFIVARHGARAVEPEVRGKWAVCTPQTVGPWSAAGYFFARDLHEALKYPVGIINSSVGNTQAQTWTPREVLEGDPLLRKTFIEPWEKKMETYPAEAEAYDKALEQWKIASEAAKTAGKPEPRKPLPVYGPDSTRAPAALYNAMIAGAAHYAIKGAVWYQGESDVALAEVYRQLLPAMVASWRKAWGGDFPFLIVQLANFQPRVETPGDSRWAALREAQRQIAKTLPHSGLAVAIDIGEAKNIHPQNKQEVGRRLALQALATVYGREIVASGPLFAKATFLGGQARVVFEPRTATGLKTVDGQPVEGFALAGKDGRFHDAQATVVPGERAGADQPGIVVRSPEVPHPVAVRYAWADNPEVNLVNAAGLPACPFSSEAP